MSTVDLDATLVSILNNATAQINRYFAFFIFVFGIIGNSLNVLVLAKKTFRSNPCALCFLVASIANIISILASLTSRILSSWAADLTSTISWLCKLRAFVLWVSRTFAIWLIVLATVDRWLLTSSNIHRRQMSTLKNIYRSMIIIFIFSTLIFTELIYCYDANMKNTPSKCYSKTEACRLFTDFTYAFVTNVIPILLMLIFGTMTISNIRFIQKRTQPQRVLTANSLNIQITRSKKMDRHLLKTLIIQVIVISILTMPTAIQKIYSTLTLVDDKSALQNAIENLIYNIVVLFISIANGSIFYIFTLYGGKIYRNAVWNLVKHIFIKIKC